MNLLKLVNEYLADTKQELSETLCSLVKIPSIAQASAPGSPYPYGQTCADALDFCKNLSLSKHLWVTDYDYHGIEVRLNPMQSGKKLLIATHTDVVDVDEESLFPPFHGELVENYVVGRGSVDDKGPLLATLYALAFFKKYQIPLQNDVRLFFGSNEESGMDDLPYYLKRAGQPDLGLAADDDFPVVNGEKGLLRFILRLPKSPQLLSLHSCGKNQRLRHDSCTAFWEEEEISVRSTDPKRNPVAEVLEKLGDRLSPDPSKNAAVSRMLCADGLKVYQANTSETELSLFFDARLPVTESIETACAQLSSFSLACGLPIELIKKSPGYFVPETDPMVTLLTKLYHQESNSNAQPYVMPACTYARLFTHGLGFGAGNPAEHKPFPDGHGACHGNDEAQNIDVLLDAVKLYILAIQAIDEFWKKN